MSSGTVTYQLGGVAIAGKVFTDFASLDTFITTQPGVTDWTILIDGSALPPPPGPPPNRGSPSILPSGSYPLPVLVAFAGTGRQPSSERLPDTGPATAFRSLGRAPCRSATFRFCCSTIWEDHRCLRQDQEQLRCRIQCSMPTSPIPPSWRGSIHFFAAIGGGDIALTLHGTSVLGQAHPGPSRPVLTVDGTSSASIILLDASTLVAGAATVAPGGTLGVFTVDSSLVDPSYFTMAGVSVTLLSVAPEVAYAPFNTIPTGTHLRRR